MEISAHQEDLKGTASCLLYISLCTVQSVLSEGEKTQHCFSFMLKHNFCNSTV